MIFRKKVYQVVKNIPKGKALTYKEVAKRAGSEKAVRAVGNIIHNSPLDVPCHRVVSADGSLSKNFGKDGIKKQEELLKKEGIMVVNGKVTGCHSDPP